MEVVERPTTLGGGLPAPWYTEQAAIIYREQNAYASEIAILQRWIDAARRNRCDVDETHPLVARMTKAQALLEKNKA